jgi:hypothetical protein
MSNFVGVVIAAIIAIGILMWVYTKSTLEENECDRMNAMYPNFASLTNAKTSQPMHKYYIKTAYNCCCPSRSYTHTYVSTCALKNCLRQGARCLDFQIYSLDNNPVIAVSAVDDFGVKNTYNSISFISAMRTIADLAFTSAGTPCPIDPLFLNFRIMSKNPDILPKMADALKDTLGGRLTTTTIGTDVGNENLSEYRGKVVVMLDPTYMDLSEAGGLQEMVDLPWSKGANYRSFRFHDLKSTTNKTELIEFNTYDANAISGNGLSMCLPNLGANPQNPSFSKVREYKCHFLAMCFQLADSNLKEYNDIFETYQTAFVLQDQVS